MMFMILVFLHMCLRLLLNTILLIFLSNYNEGLLCHSLVLIHNVENIIIVFHCYFLHPLSYDSFA